MNVLCPRYMGFLKVHVPPVQLIVGAQLASIIAASTAMISINFTANVFSRLMAFSFFCVWLFVLMSADLGAGLEPSRPVCQSPAFQLTAQSTAQRSRFR